MSRSCAASSIGFSRSVRFAGTPSWDDHLSRPLFRQCQVEVEGEATTYSFYEPAAASAGRPAPVILFLHGAGESGNDGVAPTTVGLGPAIQRNPASWPALVVFPQASRGYGWRGFNLSAALAALADVEVRHSTDIDRVYVTGISMGGYGTWLTAVLQPERFAAIIPVCGGLDGAAAIQAGALDAASSVSTYEHAARRLESVPQWAFHGDADDVIPVQESRTMIGALRTAGADARYTEYAGVRHNSWDRAYAEPELAPWLLRQHR